MLSDRISKRVPVKLISDFTFDKQFEISSDIEITPSHVEIYGPRQLLDEINEVETEELKIKNLHESTEKAIKLNQFSDKNLSLNATEVLVRIPVEKFTEGTLEVPIEAKNVKKGFNVKFIPDKIRVKYLVALSRYNDPGVEMFRAVVDFSKVESEASSKVKVDLVKEPAFVRSVSYTPQRVDYILRK